MLIYTETDGNQISATTPTHSIDFVPTLDISDRVCYLKVEQFYMSSSTSPRTTSFSEQYNVVRCNLTQPHSQAFKGTSAIGNNSVIFIRNLQCPWAGPQIPVYVPSGPQKLTFTFDIVSTSAVTVGMLISLVAVDN